MTSHYFDFDCGKAVGAGLNGAAAGERPLRRAAAGSTGEPAGCATGGTAEAAARGRAQTRTRHVTEIVAEKNTNTHDDGRTKHQTRRAHAQDGQQSKQGGHLKRRGCAQRAHV